MARCLAASLAPFALAFTGTTAEDPATPAIGASAGDPAADERALQAVSAQDWGSIRAAHESWKRSVFATPDGFAALHPTQGWRSAFDGRGLSISPAEGTPDEGAWRFGLELERWGFAGALREVDGQATGCADGERVEYVWDASLTEWYENGARGLEHGYTVYRRPPGEGALVLELAVRGDLELQVDADGRGARFVDASRATVLTYAGLAVFDAAGRALDAQLVAQANGLRIEVDERGARYPLTIDPTVQQAYLKASNTDPSDEFGIAVAISENTVVVGAYAEDSNSTAIGAGQADDSAANAGAAYVFVRSGTTWSQQAYLKPSNCQADDRFGQAVAISGNTLVIGASQEDSSSTTIGAGQGDNSAGNSGAAYVFVRSGTTWTQQAYLKAWNTGVSDQFGFSVGISGDTVVVGAVNEDSNSITINSGQTDRGAFDAGAAYVFVRSGTSWSQQAYLKPFNTGPADNFGWSCAVSGDTVVVGARQEDSNSTTIGMGQFDESLPSAGAAYVFVRSGTTWSQQAYLKAFNTFANDFFGTAVSVWGDTVVVGASGEDSNSTTINAGQTNNTATDAGAAYVFVRSGTAWSQQSYLKPSNTGAGDQFGWSVGISADTVVVGARTEDSNSTTVDLGHADNSAASAGAAYAFARTGTAWGQAAYLKASNTDAGDELGFSVAVSGDTAVVGAFQEDGNSTTIDVGQADDSTPGAGAAYVFRLPTPDPVPYCFGDGTGTACPCSPAPVAHGDADKGCPNNIFLGGAKLAWSGAASLGADTLVLTATNVINAGGCLVYQGTNDNGGGLGTVFGDGLRCAAGSVARMRTHIVAGNMYQYPDPGFGDNAISIRGAVTVPGTRYYQGWYRSANPTFCTAATFNLTNGVRVTWGS